MLMTLPAYGQYIGGGSSAFAFMGLPVSARLNALGGSNVSVRDGDITMAMNNPALLGDRTHMVLSMNFCYIMQGTMFASAMYGHNFGRSKIEKPFIDANGVPDKPNYFMAGIYYLDHGKMQYADQYGNLTGGSFTAKDIVIHATYARQLGEHFSVGVTLKPVMSFYESYNSFAIGADVGGHFQMKDSTLQVGLTLQNIGWQLKGFYSREGGQQTELLPLNLQLGLSYHFKHAPLRLSFTYHNMQTWKLDYQNADISGLDMFFRHTIFTIEVMPKSERFWIALSYNHRHRAEMNLKDQRSFAGFHVGAGVRIYKFRLNFALSQLTKSNLTYQVGLALDINSMMK